MKILFVGDYSNLHACLAAELRTRGHEVTVVSDGGRYMDTAHDVLLDRSPGLAGAVRYLYDVQRVWRSLRGYDVVQLINPHFAALRPRRMTPLLHRLRDNNRSLFLTLAGDDHFFVKACAEGSLFRFSEYRVGGETTEFVRTSPVSESGWLLPEVARYNALVCDMVDGAMSVLPEYDMAARPVMGDKVVFTNIPVDLARLPFKPLEWDGRTPLRIMTGIRGGMETRKGTARLAEAAERLARRWPDRFAATRVQDVSLAEYMRCLANSHVVLDQMYSYSPATNALQTMALGRIAGSGGQPEFYDAIGWRDDRPVLVLEPDTDVAGALERLAADPGNLRRRSVLGRRLVEQNNDVRTVASRFERHWAETLEKK